MLFRCTCYCCRNRPEYPVQAYRYINGEKQAHPENASGSGIFFTRSSNEEHCPPGLLYRGNSLTMNEMRTWHRGPVMEITARTIAFLVQYGDSDPLITWM